MSESKASISAAPRVSFVRLFAFWAFFGIALGHAGQFFNDALGEARVSMFLLLDRHNWSSRFQDSAAGANAHPWLAGVTGQRKSSFPSLAKSLSV
jgi:hypothetical protein